ncbi:hypothetical protein PAHAL_5G220500 [Panicum hallii]|uniref:Uncharacterized protein n=1 Tax=Panicum hallii TaxID=206008 RepID=A0A2T8IKU0_9POAL|nr:hypothetical protein PAHAL_5G220500 [Panicum hallii]
MRAATGSSKERAIASKLWSDATGRCVARQLTDDQGRRARHGENAERHAHEEERKAKLQTALQRPKWILRQRHIVKAQPNGVPTATHIICICKLAPNYLTLFSYLSKFFNCNFIAFYMSIN